MVTLQTEKPRTRRDWVEWGEDYFEQQEIFLGHGTDNAFDEALALVLHVLGLGYDLSEEDLLAEVPAEASQSLVELFKRRVEERIPAAYLTNKVWFCGLEFYVNQDVLIPRSPIAELIERQCSPWANPSAVLNILDLCTGSGCIGIASAYAFPDARVDLADISSAALLVAETNRQSHRLQERVQLHQSDLFEALPQKAYDLILTNPPYVGRKEMGTLPAEYRHEPSLGLEAAQDGLEIMIRILAEARRFLGPDGILIAEVGASQSALQSRFPAIPFLWLEFDYGGDGVFLLTADQLEQYQGQFTGSGNHESTSRKNS